MRRIVQWLAVACALMCGSASAHPGALNEQGCHTSRDDTRHCHQARGTQLRSRVPKVGEEGILDGSLMWVTDGDSLRALVNGQDMEIRLADVDAPERGQPYGWEAKLALIDLVRGRHIVLAPRDVDHHGRIVARIWAGEIDVNRELVKRGAAWFYPAYAEDESLFHEEQRARTAKLGLWGVAGSRIEPWEWRRREREANAKRKSPVTGRQRAGRD
jgi:endonuclease YncB( thermonuclease family)